MGVGWGGRGRWTDRWTGPNQFPICPFNFFEVGDITMHKCTSYCPDNLNLWPLLFDLQVWPRPSTYVNKCFEWHFSFSKTTVQKWNPCINVPVMAQTSSIYDHFDLYLTPLTLTFNLPEKNVSNSTSPPREQQTVQNYFEIHALMYKLWSGQAKYMTILTFIWPLWSWPSTHLKECIKWHLSSRTNCAKLFWNPKLLYKIWSGQIQTDAQTP